MKFPSDRLAELTRRRSVRIMAAVVGALFVAAAAIYGLAQGPANKAAEDYDADLKQWQSKSADVLAGRKDALKSSLFEFKDFGSAAELGQLRRQCKDLTASAQRVADLNELKAPKLANVRFGSLSSTYRSTQDDADRYAQKLTRFQRESSEATAQFARDCRYLNKLGTADVRVKAAADKVASQGLRSGEQYVAGGRVYGCPKSATCAPARAEFSQFAAALRGSLAAKRARAEVNNSAECARSALGKDLCVLALDGWQEPLIAEQKYVSAVIKTGGRANSAEQKRIAALYRAMNQSYDQAGEGFAQAATKRWPGLADAPDYPPDDVSEYYTLYLVANERLARLRSLAAEVVGPTS